jgi:polysaccharide deacetylase 2 family uncharacterized protein YibQ
LATLRWFFAGWRGLGRFWALVAAICALMALTLLLAGPPVPSSPPTLAPALAPGPSPAPTAEAVTPPAKQTVAAVQGPKAGRDTPGPIADPDPALLEAVPGSPAEPLPRIAGDGRMPMQVYAAGFDASTRRSRVGLILAGLGLDQSLSEAAIHALPGGVTLAFSPYAKNPARLLEVARAAEHEYLLSVPLEPQGFPLNDPGKQALMSNLPPEQNRARLEWVLSRIAGYVGAIGAEGSLRGERFASLPEVMQPVLAEFAQRGLLYVDPRPGAPALPLVWSGTVDLVVDVPEGAADIDDKLAKLSEMARAKGSALGFAGTVRPVTTQRLATWANGLAAAGLALAPVSALVHMPSPK